MEKAFIKPYEQGWASKPAENSWVTPQIMDNYDQAIDEIDNRVIAQIEDLTQFSNDGFLPKNLFDKDSATNGRYDASGNLLSTTNWCHFRFKVKPNTQYTISGVRQNDGVPITQWTSNGTVIATTFPYRNSTITTSTDAEYIDMPCGLIGSSSDDRSTLQFEEGSRASTYKPYAKPNTELTQIVDDAISSGYISTNKFKGDVSSNLSMNGSGVVSSSSTYKMYATELPSGTYTITTLASANFLRIAESDTIPTSGNTVTVLRNPDSGANPVTVNLTKKYLLIFIANTDEMKKNTQIFEGTKTYPQCPSNIELKENLAKNNIFSDVSSKYSVGVGNGVTLHDYKIQKNGNLYYVYLNISIAQDLSHNSLVVSGLPKARTYMKASLDVSTQRNLLKIDNGVNMYAFGTVKACSYAVASFMYIAD